MFDGVTAFTLYDTYGFPLDLTQDALRPRGIGVDIASFTDAMEEQRKKARASWAGSGEAADEAVWFGLREKLGGTEFLGYETEERRRASSSRCCATARKWPRCKRARAAPSSSTRRRSTPNPAARSATPAR